MGPLLVVILSKASTKVLLSKKVLSKVRMKVSFFYFFYYTPLRCFYLRRYLRSEVLSKYIYYFRKYLQTFALY